MNCVIVTGANGFIGQALCKGMASNGWHVRGTVRSIEQAASLPAGVEVVQIESIGPDTDWSDALAGVDTVVHLAARVHVMNDTAAEPIAVFRQVNVAGTERLARIAATNGVKRFIFLSTVKVNGKETENRQFTERDIPNPHDDYSTSKWEAEQALHNISDATGLEIVILRLPLVYGQGVKANFLRLLDLVARRIPLPLAHVNNRRSLIYLGNLTDAIVTCIIHPKAAGQTYMVSDGQDVSTPELIRMIAKAMGKKARLFPCPAPLLKMIGKIAGKSSEVERLTGSLQIDSAKIRKTLNWTPPFTIEEGICKTVQWYIKI